MRATTDTASSIVVKPWSARPSSRVSKAVQGLCRVVYPLGCLILVLQSGPACQGGSAALTDDFEPVVVGYLSGHRGVDQNLDIRVDGSSAERSFGLARFAV